MYCSCRGRCQHGRPVRSRSTVSLICHAAANSPRRTCAIHDFIGLPAYNDDAALPISQARLREPVAGASTPAFRTQTMTSIGATIVITGELTSSEDVTVDGRVDGQLLVRDAAVTVNERAQVQATV